MPYTSLLNLASPSKPTFLFFSGNLNMCAAWTECSLAWWLQLVCFLASRQLLSCALMPLSLPTSRKSSEC